MRRASTWALRCSGSALFLALAIAGCGRSQLGVLDYEDLPSTGGGAGSAHDAGKDQVAPDAPDGADAWDAKDAADAKDAPWDHVVPDAKDGGKCASDLDCEDLDACTEDTCSGGVCTNKLRDLDDDTFVAAECGGPDCNDLNPQVNPAMIEDCFDGADNDCNGLSDCNDIECTGVPGCGCVPAPGGEDCANGKDDDCDTTADCNDPDCVGTPACGCLPNEKSGCQNGKDDDCDGKLDCQDNDCTTTKECICASQTESCSNGVDDDCDLLIDCVDPQCASSPSCTCIPPGVPEVCVNGQDDDCNGLVDCADPGCFYDPSCGNCVPEDCSNGKDDDCNGFIDCADTGCKFEPACAPVPEVCNNSLDDDKDGKTDCDDPDCKTNPVCVAQQGNCLTAKLITGSGSYTGDTTGTKSDYKGSCGGDAGEAVFYFVLSKPTQVLLDTVGTSFDAALYVRAGSCESGAELGCDDDSGGAWAAKVDFSILYPGTYYVFVDGFTVDPNGGANEGPFTLNVTFNEEPKELCDNGIDDDGDHYVDCADGGCKTVGACLNCNAGKAPGPEFGASACTNGLDDDCDGEVDCKDSDCNASEYYKAECCNDADDNGNQIIDDFACRCVTDADCPMDQMCYTHSVWACGPPCTNFFGNICVFVAPGSQCSTVSQQCEF